MRLGGGSAALAAALALALLPADPAAAQANPLQGGWTAEEYLLASGDVHPVRGRIFFTDRDWTVLYFVIDADGTPRRGSAEGGEYTLEGDRLTFTHEFNLSGGAAMAGLPEANWSMTVRDAEGAVLEPTRIAVEGEGLTLFFPSGNRMTFTRR